MIFGIMSCGKTSPFDADSTDRRSCAKKVESNGLYRRALPPSLPMIQNPGTFAVNFGPAFWTCALFLTGLWGPSSLQAHSEVASLQKTDAETTPRPNIILFVTDDLSPDLGCYGNPAIRTPHIDALAADGVRFRRAFCTTASCSASRSVILTGWFNHANGHYGHQHSYHHFSAFDKVKSLPVRLQESGYRTVRIGKYHVAPEEIFKFTEALPGNARSPVEMANRCEAVFASESEDPFFLYFCTADPHRGGGVVEDNPHRPDRFGNRPQGYPGITPITYGPEDVIVPPFLPNTPVCRSELSQYYQSVSRIDQGVGRLVELLKQTGKYENTLILLTSDHGIAFPGGKTTVYEPGLTVPMIAKPVTATKRNRVSNAMVSLVDLTPTILTAAQVEVPAKEFHGQSFLGEIDGATPLDRETVFASHTFHEITMYYPMRVVRGSRYKLIWNLAHGLPYPFASDLWKAPTWQNIYEQGMSARYGQRTVEAYIHRPAFELYDLQTDPHEIHNLADSEEHQELLERLKKQLRQFQKETQDPWILKWDYE
jgi:N-sulfoglucosamine sulfohydrolase